MLNRPFSSINTNVIDERFQNTVPTTICGQNVVVSQEQQKRVCNCLSTSIAGMSGCCPIQQTQPNSVTFQFSSPECVPQTQSYQSASCPCTSLGLYTQMAPCNPLPQYNQFCPCNYLGCCNQLPPSQPLDSLQKLQQANCLDFLKLQQQLFEPYQLKLHLDNQTSTSDLSQNVCRAAFNNLSGIALLDNWPYWLDKPKPRDRKLILKNVTAKLDKNTFDNLNDQKKVTFDSERSKDEEVQVQMGTTTDEESESGDEKKTKRRKSKKKKSSSTTDED